MTDSLRARFIAGLGFTPDPFQLAAFDHLDQGRQVVVAAPTGSGKTLVAAYGVAAMVGGGQRVFYTTPIKALSNQKFQELAATYGSTEVGLLTGDNSINPGAPVVVMTTEVLRNMLYAGNSLTDLGGVVLDEVHYLQDPYRGSVWEEVIIHLPPHVRLISLSATVSNAKELSDWIETVRGPTGLVVETERPVRLDNMYMVGERAGSHIHLIGTTKGGKANPKGFRFESDPRQMRNRGGGNRSRGRPQRRWRTPNRGEVVATLEHRGLLPAIYFIFSRAACDDAARAVLASGMVLTTGDERRQIEAIVDDKLSGLDRRELEVLGFRWFVEALKAGIGPHHAGMVPPFKEAVEACFERNLLKVVFATETLALGVNMPARSVILEKLTKFTGEGHDMLTPAQYTQLTGRAGRRGIDTRGTAVVLWSPFVRFGQVADLALSRQFELTSSFRPTYNMAANLVRRFDRDEARHLLNLSFAQFRVDAGVVRSEQRVGRLEQRHHQIKKRIEKEYGPVEELLAALDHRGPAEPDREEITFALRRLRPGDVIRWGPHPASLVLAVAARSKGRVMVKTTTAEGQTNDLTPTNLDHIPVVVGEIELPEPYLPNSVAFVHQAATSLGRSRVHADGPKVDLGPTTGIRRAADVPAPARKALKRLAKAEHDLDRARALEGHQNRSLAARFDRVIALLEQREHLVTSPQGWDLTETGQRLARLYHESDLLVIEALEEGLMASLNPAELAALVSTLVYEDRGGRSRGPKHHREPADVWFPSPRLKRAYERLEGLHHHLELAEVELDLPVTSKPQPGMVGVAHAWAAGGDLADVLDGAEITAGDFVRLAKQLVDLLGQLSKAAPPGVGAVARQARTLMFRDLVAASSMVGDLNLPDDDNPNDAPHPFEGSGSPEP